MQNLLDAGAGVEQALHIWSSRVRANLGAWLAEVTRQINTIRYVKTAEKPI